jgi:TPR repeat protein
MLFDGDGVPQDKEEAVRLYRRAADSNHADAEFELGMKFLNGDIDAGHLLSKEEKAVRFITSAATHGHAQAQHQVAVWLMKGGLPDGSVDTSESEYVQFMTAAADQGFADVQHHLAKFCLDKDHHSDAFKYFCLAAEQGHADSQYHAGHLFFHGVGCSEDFAEGRKMRQLAAAQGLADAQADLYGLFFHGNFGVEKNLVEVNVYFTLEYSTLCVELSTLTQSIKVLAFSTFKSPS